MIGNFTRRAAWLCVALAAGCGAPSPGPDTRRGCAQLGWACGTDDYGNTCGSCPTGQACSFGACRVSSSSCSCGSRVCGVDPVCGTTSCGTCSGGRECVAGVCLTPVATCSITAWSACNPTASTTCCPLPNGVATICSTYQSGQSFCNPRCATDADCDRYSGSTNTWYCALRNDGQRACALR